MNLPSENEVATAAQRHLAHALTIARHTCEGLFLLDTAGRLTYVNPAGERLLGMPADEMLGQAFEDLVQAKPAISASGYLDVLRQGTPILDEEQLWTSGSGTARPVTCSCSPILEGGTLVGVVVGARDLSALKTVGKERDRLIQELGEALRLRDEFLSIASHELKTPLTALKLRVQTILRQARRHADKTYTGAELEEKLAPFSVQVERLSTMIDRLLDLSRLESNRLALDIEVCDLQHVVMSVVSQMREAAAVTGSNLTVGEIPTLYGYWDRTRLEQVITNLLSNAIKYGEGKPIEVAVSTAPDQVTISVRDHGVGIAPEDHVRVFERYERATSTRQLDSLGLGLYITRQIVQAHGGDISVASALGQGATFSVRLPLRRVPAGAHA